VGAVGSWYKGNLQTMWSIKDMIRLLRSLVFNVLAAAFLIMLLYGLITTPAWSAGQVTAIFLATFLAAFIGNLEYIETFKASASGFEARIRKTEAAVNELHELAAMTGAMLIELIASGGRWGGDGPAAKDAQKARVLESLRVIGVPQERIIETGRADRRWVINDYFSGIMRGPTQRVRPEQNAEWTAFINTVKGLDRPGPDETLGFLDRLGLLDDFSRELIEDYRHYLRTGEHRRPNVWASRGDW
jgi:hypothetical protein